MIYRPKTVEAYGLRLTTVWAIRTAGTATRPSLRRHLPLSRHFACADANRASAKWLRCRGLHGIRHCQHRPRSRASASCRPRTISSALRGLPMNTAVLVHQPVLALHSEQMNAILMALSALRRGDATVRLPLTGEGRSARCRRSSTSSSSRARRWRTKSHGCRKSWVRKAS